MKIEKLINAYKSKVDSIKSEINELSCDVSPHPADIELCKKLGLNVILQDNEACVNDGSLSVHCGKNNIPYINVEAQKGHLSEQIDLIRIVIDILNK